MIRISLTDFVDFVSKSGSPKITKVRQIKSRQDYHPSRDFYKYLRDAIKLYHEENHTDKNTYFRDVLNASPDAKKKTKFTNLTKGYQRFLGTKSISHHESNNVIWTQGELEVNVNPELCLTIDNEKHLIKLYFKSDELTKLRIDVILYLMQNALPIQPNIDKFTILYIEKSRMLSEAKPDTALQFLLQAEAESFITIYKNLP
jgi:hypothetical protein